MTTTINWFEIPVADLDRAQAFYEKVLGRALQARGHGRRRRWRVFPYEEPGHRRLPGRPAPPARAATGSGVRIYLDCMPEHRRRAVARGAGGRAGRDARRRRCRGDMGFFARAARHRRQRSRPARAGLTAMNTHRTGSPSPAPSMRAAAVTTRRAASCRSATASSRRSSASAAGDRVAYYAPATAWAAPTSCKASSRSASCTATCPTRPTWATASCRGGATCAMRRAREAPILPLIEQFDFVDDPKRWGSKFRFGLFEVNEHDIRLIAGAMKADAQALGL